MSNVKIKETKIWYWDDVRNLCIKEDWYTQGNCKEYDKMLNFVMNNKPTKTNIYHVALDILEHTDVKQEQTVKNIMFHLANDVVTYCYEIEKDGVII